MAAERSKRFFGEGCLRVSSRTKSKGLRWKDHFVHGKRTGQRLRGFVCFHLGCTWGGRREALSRAWAFLYYGELGARGGVWMRRERRSRTACNHSVGSKKKVRCVQQEGRSPGGSSGRSGGRGWEEHLEVLLQGVAVVGHALIGLAVLSVFALEIVGLL